MLEMNIYKLYQEYPETLTVKEMREMLGGITKYAALKLIHDGEIACKKIARVYRIPKENVLRYMILNNKCKRPE